MVESGPGWKCGWSMGTFRPAVLPPGDRQDRVVLQFCLHLHRCRSPSPPSPPPPPPPHVGTQSFYTPGGLSLPRAITDTDVW